MSSLVLGLVVLAGASVCLADFRKGVVVIFGLGLLQDLIRKLAPGQPTYLMGLVFVAFAATFLGALVRENPRWWRRREWGGLRQPMALFGFALVVQAGVSYFRLGSTALIGLGLAAYAGPIAALVLGSWAGSRAGSVQRYLAAYLLLVLAMASGIVLYQLGYRWPSLLSVGQGLVVYDLKLGAIYLPPGFFRAPEVASWHCATAACVALVLAAARQAPPGRRAALGALAVFLFWCVVATGRRKGLGEIVIFLMIYLMLQLWLRGRLGRLGGAAFATVLLGAFAFQRYGLREMTAGQIGSMRERTEAGGGAGERFLGGVATVPNVIGAAGLLGTGLGTGTQGGQHFRAEGESWTVISESGLARVVAELGVPGSIAAMLLLFRFVRLLWRRAPTLRQATESDPAIILGLTAILVANAIVFVAAHQIFGDPFVYIFLGLAAGFVVAALGEKETAAWRERRRTAVQATAA